MSAIKVPAYARQLIELAHQLGAVDAVYFTPDQLVFDPRTLLKCMFGCGDWGRGLTCPSRAGFPGLDAYREMLMRYRWGVIVHAHDKAVSHKASFALESRAFHDGYYFAFSLSDCACCKTCAGFDGQPCRRPDMARPAFHSVGIDVFATVRQFDLPLYTLSDPQQEQQNWYSAVFVE